eukprot:GDKI01007462.1.p1 GENE.GDKI01007462.1~~GDKI01007462.1.p1  ORF type:complete len:246 (+),score=14.98 GDKI01007462.1:83-820(+)
MSQQNPTAHATFMSLSDSTQPMVLQSDKPAAVDAPASESAHPSGNNNQLSRTSAPAVSTHLLMPPTNTTPPAAPPTQPSDSNMTITPTSNDALSKYPPIRHRISSHIEDLNRLSEMYVWVPNEHMIRPTEADLAYKYEVHCRIQAEWPSMREYVWKCILKETQEEWVFCPSMFRYRIPPEAHHYVLWNTNRPFDSDTNLDDSTVNGVLNAYFESKNVSVDYVWYKNPKPSVEDYWHVQVFWILLD